MAFIDLPDEIDFLSFFESEPIHRDIEDAVTFGYEFKQGNIRLLFYFTAYEGCVSLILKQEDTDLLSLSLSEITRISITEDERALIIWPKANSAENNYYVQVRPTILINNKGYAG
ncbi:hypothetical protein [Providencia sp.]|uniref:hypothetical protein n=1 Tax=Providencia sp. TaxID=589 RepID=UPI0033429265